MARNGSGTYTLPSGNPVVSGTTISATVQNNTMSDIATALTQSIAKDGQTVPTANLPMGGFKHTGLAAGTAAGDSVRYEQAALLAGATFTGYINEARGTVTMHATTMDLWSQPNVIDGTGSAVTITAIANAPQAGARRTLYPIAGTVITNGATFSVDGGADYTTAAGDKLEFEAVTTSTYKVHITKKDGTPISIADASITQAKFASNVAGNGPAFSAYNSASQSINSGVLSTVTFDTKIYDTNSNLSGAVFTPTVAGYYHIEATIQYQGTAYAGIVSAKPVKNGTALNVNESARLGTQFITMELSFDVSMNGTTDALTIGCTQSQGGAQNVRGLNFSGHLMRAA